MLNPHLLPLLVLPLLATACIITPDPPPLPLTPNAAAVRTPPGLSRACPTITWTLEYHREGEDVTPEARYMLNQASWDMHQEAIFTFAPDPQYRRLIAVEPFGDQGPVVDPAFAGSVFHTFTCNPGGETAGIQVDRSPYETDPRAPFPIVSLKYEQGALFARPE